MAIQSILRPLSPDCSHHAGLKGWPPGAIVWIKFCQRVVARRSGFLADFQDFINKGSVVDLAVADALDRKGL
jgi:hypothetical protein